MLLSPTIFKLMLYIPSSPQNRNFEQHQTNQLHDVPPSFFFFFFVIGSVYVAPDGWNTWDLPVSVPQCWCAPILPNLLFFFNCVHVGISTPRSQSCQLWVWSYRWPWAACCVCWKPHLGALKSRLQARPSLYYYCCCAWFCIGMHTNNASSPYHG